MLKNKIGLFMILLFTIILLFSGSYLVNAEKDYKTYEDDEGYYDNYSIFQNQYYDNNRSYEKKDKDKPYYYYHIKENENIKSYELNKKKNYKNIPSIIVENKIPFSHEDTSIFCNTHNSVNNNHENEKCLIECPDSGFIVSQLENCPQKCEDGTYVMQEMECPSLVSQLTVKKNFNGCVIHKNGPIPVDCPPGVPSTPQEFTINVDGNNVNPLSSFPGDNTGTILTMDEGVFEVKEEQVDSTAPLRCNNILFDLFDAGTDLGNGQYICTTFDNCSGHIKTGDELTCTIENTIAIDISTDLVVANANSNNLTVLLGNGDGTFTEEPTESPISTGNRPLSIAIDFFNADANLDLAVPNLESIGVTILLGDGDGTFTEQDESPIDAGGTTLSIAVGFFDQDSNLDLAITNFSSGVVTILLGNGDGTFTEQDESPIDVGANPRFIAVGFFDQDSNLDMAVANGASNNVTILLGNGDGTFTEEPTESPISVGDTPLSIAVGFFDQDSNLDMAVANGASNNVTILLGNGDGTFTEEPTESPISVGDTPLSIAVGFFDQDSNLDMAVANGASNNVTILLGNGDGTFTEEPTESPISVGDTPGFVGVGFFNADSTLDLAIANVFSNDITILLGNGDGTFTEEPTESPISVGDEPRFIGIGNLN